MGRQRFAFWFLSFGFHGLALAIAAMFIVVPENNERDFVLVTPNEVFAVLVVEFISGGRSFYHDDSNFDPGNWTGAGFQLLAIDFGIPQVHGNFADERAQAVATGRCRCSGGSMSVCGCRRTACDCPGHEGMAEFDAIPIRDLIICQSGGMWPHDGRVYFYLKLGRKR